MVRKIYIWQKRITTIGYEAPFNHYGLTSFLYKLGIEIFRTAEVYKSADRDLSY